MGFVRILLEYRNKTRTIVIRSSDFPDTTDVWLVFEYHSNVVEEYV